MLAKIHHPVKGIHSNQQRECYMNKIVLITGGSNGIGKATAIEMAKRGVNVILTYNHFKQRADDVVTLIEESNMGVQAIALKLDLTKREHFPEFVRQVSEHIQTAWGRKTLDYLVNNGGTGGPCLMSEMTEEYFDRIMETNYKGTVFLTQSLLPLLENGGAIVNTTSSSKSQSFPGYSIYGSLKAALSVWTRYVAKELSPRRIRVNAVSPGPTHTHFGNGVMDKHPELLEPLAEQTAFGRIGHPEDLSKVIANLLSEDFGWVTAQDIEVSGGHLL